MNYSVLRGDVDGPTPMSTGARQGRRRIAFGKRHLNNPDESRYDRDTDGKVVKRGRE